MNEQRLRLPEGVDQERRSTIRFALDLEVRYAVLGKAHVETGIGRTTDLSSSGLCFAADKSLRVGQKLRISIDWPALLSGGVELQLMILGVVNRTKGTETAVSVERYEFKTRRKTKRDSLQDLCG
jgi:hypothetical protein